MIILKSVVGMCFRRAVCISIFFTIGSVSLVTAQRISTIAGGSLDEGPSTTIQLTHVADVTIDPSGNFFLIDNHKIRRVDGALGTLDTFAGTGVPGYTGDTGLAKAANINSPNGIVADAAGNIYIADQSNNVIRKVTAATGIITTVAGDGSYGESGDGGSARNAKLNSPADVTLDLNGDLYFTDQDYGTIRKVTLSTGVITKVAGTGIPGYSGDNQLAVNAQLDLPGALTVGNNILYVVDRGNFCVRQIDLSTGIITTVAGVGIRGFSGDEGLAINAQFDAPAGIAVSADGDIYISDRIDNRIRKVDHNSGVITTIAGNGKASDSGDGGLASESTILAPYGLTLNGEKLYVASFDNGVVREIDLSVDGIHTIAGNGGYGGDLQPAISGSLNLPNKVAFDASGNIFIADYGNHRIRKITTSTGLIETIAGNGVPDFNGDSIPAVSASLNFPSSIAFDKSGNLYVADGLNYRIRKIDMITGQITTTAGTGVNMSAAEEDTAAVSPILLPADLAFDSDNNLYFSEGNVRVKKIDAITGLITTAAGSAAQGFDGDGGPATSAKLFGCTGIALDADNNLFIADVINSRIRKVDHLSGIISTIAGNGTPSGGTDGALATDVGVNPKYLTIDAAGDLYVSEGFVIRKITKTSGVITAVAGDKSIGFSGDGGLPLQAEFNETRGIGFDKDNVLYVPDNYNNRIRKICLVPLTPKFAISDVTNKSALLTSSSANGNQWYRDGVLIGGAIGNTLSVTTPGKYSLTVTAGTCTSLSSDEKEVTFTVIGVEAGKDEAMAMFPIPTSTDLKIILQGFKTGNAVDIFIYDMMGRRVETLTGEGGEMIVVNVKGYTSGKYILLARQGNALQSRVFLKN